jgi:hypothetical protein
MARRNSLLALFLGTLACGAAYASAFLPGDPPEWSPWALGIGTGVVMVAASALGAARADTGIGRLKLPFAIVFLIVAGGFAAVLLMPAPDAANPTLFLGLPAGAAIVLLGIGILPLLVLPIAYALTFEDMTLSEADLARVREAARAWQSAQVTTTTPPAPIAKPEPAEVVA